MSYQLYWSLVGAGIALAVVLLVGLVLWRKVKQERRAQANRLQDAQAEAKAAHLEIRLLEAEAKHAAAEAKHLHAEAESAQIEADIIREELEALQADQATLAESITFTGAPVARADYTGARAVDQVLIDNWQATGTDVAVPQYSVDIGVTWTDYDGDRHNWTGRERFPNVLQEFPLAVVRYTMEELILQAVRVRLGIDEWGD